MSEPISKIVTVVNDAPSIRRTPAQRLFVDESGDHTKCHREEDPIGTRYLGLVGVALSAGAEHRFTGELEKLKATHFGKNVILHREEIVGAKGTFACLQNAKCRQAFDDDLLKLLEVTDFTVFSVVIDKHTHQEKDYRLLKHPYHYCLHALMERYCSWLRFYASNGDVMVEQRGKKENKELKAIYREICEQGTKFMSCDLPKARLSSRELKLKPKSADIPGLQLADLLAHPITRDVLVANKRIPNCGTPFAERIADIVRTSKYNRWKWAGKIDGYGRVLLS